jgi:hypothetical protein
MAGFADQVVSRLTPAAQPSSVLGRNRGWGLTTVAGNQRRSWRRVAQAQGQWAVLRASVFGFALQGIK